MATSRTINSFHTDNLLSAQNTVPKLVAIGPQTWNLASSPSITVSLDPGPLHHSWLPGRVVPLQIPLLSICLVDSEQLPKRSELLMRVMNICNSNKFTTMQT